MLYSRCPAFRHPLPAHKLFARDNPALCDAMRIVNYHHIPNLLPTAVATKTPDPLPESPLTSPMATWRKSHKTVSSIFKPRRIGRNITDSSSVQQQRRRQQQHTSNQHQYHISNHPQYHPPSYLSVPMLSSGGSTIASSSFTEPYYYWNNNDVRSTHHLYLHPHQQEHQHQQHYWHSAITAPYYYWTPTLPTTEGTTTPPSSSSSSSTLRSHKTIRFIDDEPTPTMMMMESSFSRTKSESNMTMPGVEISPELFHGDVLREQKMLHPPHKLQQFEDVGMCQHTEAEHKNSNRLGFVSRRGRRHTLISRNATH